MPVCRRLGTLKCLTSGTDGIYDCAARYSTDCHHRGRADRARGQQSGAISAPICWPAAAACRPTKFATSAPRWPAFASSTSFGTKRKRKFAAAPGPAASASTARAKRWPIRGLDWANFDKANVGVYVGVTEHGNVETENEIFQLKSFDYDTKFWSHHHNPRTVANNPAGEISLNLGITGPHYTIGAACAAGNAGLIQGAQMLLLGECDVALAGGVSESIHTFGIFASFKAQGALAWHDDPTKASRPMDAERTGIVVAEGGCMYVLERMSDARDRDAKIYGEIVGWAMNSDASDFVMPNPDRQAQCMQSALRRSGMAADEIDIVSTHATGTTSGDAQECQALRQVFGGSSRTRFNNTKSFIGHAMGAAGALELAGNLPAFDDGRATQRSTWNGSIRSAAWKV